MFNYLLLNYVIHDPNCFVKLCLADKATQELLILSIAVGPKSKYVVSGMYDHSLRGGLFVVLHEFVLKYSRKEFVTKRLFLFSFDLLLFLVEYLGGGAHL